MERDLWTLAEVDYFSNEEMRESLRSGGHFVPRDGNKLRIKTMMVMANLHLLAAEDAVLCTSPKFIDAYLGNKDENVPQSAPHSLRGKVTFMEWLYILFNQCPKSLVDSIVERTGTKASLAVIRENSAANYFVTLCEKHAGTATFTGETSECTLDGGYQCKVTNDDGLAVGNLRAKIIDDFKNRPLREILSEATRLSVKASKVYPFVQRILCDTDADVVLSQITYPSMSVTEHLRSFNEDPVDEHRRLLSRASSINRLLMSNGIFHYGLVPNKTFLDEYDNLWLTEFNAAYDKEIIDLKSTFEDSWDISSILPQGI